MDESSFGTCVHPEEPYVQFACKLVRNPNVVRVCPYNFDVKDIVSFQPGDESAHSYWPDGREVILTYRDYYGLERTVAIDTTSTAEELTKQYCPNRPTS